MLKSKLSQVLVALPLLAVPLAAIAVKPLLAATAAEEAVRILVKARTADGRCNYLSAAERSELSRYAARAEIAAASQASPKSAKAAATAGQAEGQSQSCSPELKADVQETLEAARAAVAAAGSNSAPRAKAEKQSRKQAKAASGDSDQADDGVDEPGSRNTGKSLEFYARIVHAYYLERECHSLPRRDADRFWHGIVRLHKAAVRTNGASAVARVKRAAQDRAAGTSCGTRVLTEIGEGYDQISSR